MTRFYLSWLAAFSALTTTPALSQDITEGDRVTLDTVFISGGLSPIDADAYGRAHSVLTAEDMDNRGIRTVQDALRALPGISVSSSGSNHTQLRVRGGEARHTLVLIDGVKAMGRDDEFILSGLETANIERIEVLRGPQSVFYGSNASTGVINIITRRGQPGVHYGATAELGNGHALTGWFTQRTERGGLSFNASVRDDHGFDQSGDGGEKDGTKRRTLGLTGDWHAGDDLTLGFTLRRSREDYRYDSPNYGATDAGDYIVDDPDQRAERNEFGGSIWSEYTVLDGRIVHRVEYQGTSFKQSDNDGPEWRGETRTLKYRLSYGLDGRDVATSAHLLNLMVERQKDDNSTAPEYRRKNTSVAIEYRGFLDSGLDIQAGLRRDKNSEFADFTSWNIGLSWDVPNRPIRLHGSAGRGLVNPTYYELFADDDFTLGNPGLRPERNTGFDLGIEAEFLNGRGLIDLTWFNEDLEDAITYSFGSALDGSSRAAYVNQPGKSPREGVEVAARLQATDDLHLALNYTYLDAKEPDGSVEIRRPIHELGLSATLNILNGRGKLTGDLRHVSGNHDTQFWGAYETRRLPSYTVVNVAAGYDVTDNLRLSSRIVNLFDKEYSDVWGYASQGRQAYVGLEAKW